MLVKFIKGNDVSFEASPVDPLVVVVGEWDGNYGLALLTYDETGLHKVGSVCLTHQIVSQVVLSPTGREMIAAATSAGHIFIYKVFKKPYRIS